jgi:large subunit ribosomal protein L14e
MQQEKNKGYTGEIMLEVGRICVKTAGREAGSKCVVVEVIDKNFVVIDGNLRRKRCNITHLEPLTQIAEIKKGASHDEVAKALETLGMLGKAKKAFRKEKPAAEKKESQPKPAKKKAAAKIPEKKPAKSKKA